MAISIPSSVKFLLILYLVSKLYVFTIVLVAAQSDWFHIYGPEQIP